MGYARATARVAFILGVTLAQHAPAGHTGWLRAAMALAYPGYDVALAE